MKKRWLVIVLALVVVLRIPSLFEPYWYGDEAIYLTIGQAINRGVPLYSGTHDHKPPLLYLVAAVAGNEFWLKFAAMVPLPMHFTSLSLSKMEMVASGQ